MCDDCGGTCGQSGRRAGIVRAARGVQPVDQDEAVDRLREVIEPIHRALRTLNAVPLLGARPFVVPGSVNGAAASSIISGSAGRLGGLSIAETTGSTGAAIRLHDGVDSTGESIMRINLGPNESVREWFLTHGIAYTLGLWFEVLSGSVEATIYLGRDR